MAEIIKDGVGTGNTAKVNANNRLYTDSVTTTENKKATDKGNSFIINTGMITLISAADTPVLYIKNTGAITIHIDAIVLGFGTATGGTITETVKTTVIRNPTNGTTIDNTNNVDINSNRNFGSTKTLSVDAYKGATGETMTDGTDHLIVLTSDFIRTVVDIDEVLPTSASLGVKVDPPSNTTSFPIYVSIYLHAEDTNS